MSLLFTWQPKAPQLTHPITQGDPLNCTALLLTKDQFPRSTHLPACVSFTLLELVNLSHPP